MVKSLSKILILILMMFLSGCASTKFEDEWMMIEDFRKKEISKMVNYIENDPSLTRRDKNTFGIKLKQYDENLEKIREFFSKK